VQNRFVGDVGDFGKYGLLRALCGVHPDRAERLRLGVIWYLVPDQGNPGHGKHTGYLKDRKRQQYRPCDPLLYNRLRDIVCSNARSVASIQGSDIFPSDTRYYDDPLSFDALPWQGPQTEHTRSDHRCKWFQQALDNAKDCDLVLVDPDNGLECESVKAHHKDGAKHVCLDELRQILRRPRSLVIYHHLCFDRTAKEQIADWRSRLIDDLDLEVDQVRALWFHRGTARVFFVVACNRHLGTIAERLNRFLGEWLRHAGERKPHFELVR